MKKFRAQKKRRIRISEFGAFSALEKIALDREIPLYSDFTSRQLNLKFSVAPADKLEMSLNRPPKTDEFDEEMSLASTDSDLLAGKIVGNFRLQRRLGKGGMGSVYLAERVDGEFRQQVAVKLIKRGMDTDFVLERFRRERQILASLDHPNIARLLNGGTTDEGLPYFVMDYVEGDTLLNFAQKNELDLRGRLELFLEICEAVEYAHRKKIVHRDLKPSNILVTSSGAAKLLDFGIAKMLDPESAPDTIFPTTMQMRLMTPEYASPEQARGQTVTTATDIYSLGVVLYELLTGRRPYFFPSRAAHEIARVICEQEPLSPSRALAEHAAGTKEYADVEKSQASNSAQTPDVAAHQLRGNLDNIVLKTLRKAPEERYESVRDLSEEIKRHLKGQKALAETYPSAGKSFITTGDFGEEQPSTGESKSIAVLPLKLFGTPNASGEDEYLGIGLADALVTRLSNVRRLVVRPTSSVLPFGDASSDPFRAGGELGVDFILDGSIRRSGERIRVSVQLLSVREKATRWAENFSEKFVDVLELEDSISERVVKSLIPRLSGDEERRMQKRGTNSPEAYEAYMRGRFHWNQFTPDALLKALDAFQAAIRIDPEYALAFVGLSDFYIWATIYGLMPSAEALSRAEAAARRAVELDEFSGEAYSSLGLARQNRFDWEGAKDFYSRALELAPNYVHAHEWMATYLIGHGDFEEGVSEMKTAARLDPLSLRTKTMLAWMLYQTRLHAEALDIGMQIVDLDPNYPQGYLQIGNNLLQMNRAEEAIVNYQKFHRMISDSGLGKYALCHGLAGAGREQEARGILNEMKILAADSYVKPYFLGMAHAALGERDAAFTLFEKAFAENDPWMVWLGTEPMLDPLRGDPRVDVLLRKMGISK